MGQPATTHPPSGDSPGEPSMGGNYWADSFPRPAPVRAPVSGSMHVDVAIVGAGYSGLWTAWYLKKLRPTLSIAILEAKTVGFGASGRNGGWVTSGTSGVDTLLANPRTRADGLAIQRAVHESIDEIGRVTSEAGIDCHYRKSGAIHFATSAAQEERLRAAADRWSEYGLGEEDCRWLDSAEVAERVRAQGQRGGLWHRNYAVMHPARLVHGLAAAVETAGVTIHENTPARKITRGRIETPGATVHAGAIVLATEAYTSRLPGRRRELLPLHSWMFATEPLSDAQWAEIGLDGREAFGDGRRLVTYGQRTEDGRIAFGARGTYGFGSPIFDRFPADHPHYRVMEDLLRGFFPVLKGVRFTHHWGGALGVPRTWLPSVRFDSRTGLGRLGGYVGQGVGASNLAGRTMAELVAGEESERTRLAWVKAPTRAWEPEPLRWLGVSAIARAAELADAAEDRGRSAPLLARLFESVTGR